MTLKVGIYDSPQVKQQAAPNARINVQVPNTGGALAQGLSTVADVLAQEEQRLSQKRIEEFDNKLTTFDLKQRSEVLKVTGQAAFAPGSDGTEPLQLFKATRDNFIAEQTKDLTPKQREAAMALAAKHGVRVEAEWQQHQDRELQAWTKSVAQDGVKVQADAAMANVNNVEAFNEALGKMAYHMQEANPGVEITETIREQQSKVALGSLRNLIGNGTIIQPDGYQHLFTKLTADDKATADELMKKGNAANMGLTVAQQVWYPGMTHSAMVSVADSMAGDNAQAHEEIVKNLQRRGQNYEADVKVNDTKVIGEVFDKVYSYRMSTSEARKQMLADPTLSKETRAKAFHDLAAWDKSNRESAEDMFPAFAAFVTSEAFPTLTRDEVLKALPGFGRMAGAVLQRWEQATADTSMRVPQVARNLAESTLLGMDVGNKEKRDELRPLLDAAILQVTDRISAESKGKGRYATKPPTAQEIANEIITLARPRIVEKRAFFRKDVTAPLATMTPAQQNDAVAALDPEMRAMVRVKLLHEGIGNPTTAQIMRASDDIEAMKTNDKDGYAGLLAAVQPTAAPTAQTRPMDRR